MCKSVFIILASLCALYIAESTYQVPYIIHPTYRPPPPPSRPIIRIARDTGEPQWLYRGDDFPRAPATGDHPFLPSYIDDIKMDPNRRTARSLSTPRASRGGGTRQSSSRGTGPTHPGYNRRNARDIRLPSLPESFNPYRPNRERGTPTWYPIHDPERIPTYVRYRRDIGQEVVASQEQLRSKRGVEPLASQEEFEQLASQEQLRTKRGVEPLASKEELEEFNSAEG